MAGCAQFVRSYKVTESNFSLNGIIWIKLLWEAVILDFFSLKS